MSTTRKTFSEPKRTTKRKAIDLETKMQIVNEYDAGKKVKVLSTNFGLSHSTVSTILKDKERIKEAAKTTVGLGSKLIITRQRKGLIAQMEKLLAIWFDDQIQKNMPMSMLVIRTKARSIFETLKEREGNDSEETFTASHGWFQRFWKRFNLHNRDISGEAAIADEDEANKFIDNFDQIIQDDGYLPEQIFNVQETCLFWKRMPEKSYIHKEAETMPGFKAFKDRVTLLLGGNVVGFKLKPLLIYRSQNPCALKQVNKDTLPVYYRANTKAGMTEALFEDWFINCFVPSTKQYCSENNIPFKIILLLDNTPGHPQHLDDVHPNIKVVYLPKNTTVILQPMDQGAIATFKAHYLHTTFLEALIATESNESAFREFWKSYNILDCIKNIDRAWKEVSEKCMQGIWKKCLNRFQDYVDIETDDYTLDDTQDKIVKLAIKLDLKVEGDDIEKLLEHNEGELTNEDLIELEEQQNENVQIEQPKKRFTLTGLANVFSKVNAALLELESMDHNTERYKKVEREINGVLGCYRTIYEEKKSSKQTTLDEFFYNATPSTSSINIDCIKKEFEDLPNCTD